MIRSSHVCVDLAEHNKSCSNVFNWASYFCFLLYIILEEDGNNIKCKQTPHCHSRLSKPILKILSIYRKNILGKQLSQAISSKYLFKLLHAPIFFFFYKLNLVKVVELFTDVPWKSWSDEFYRKKHMQECFLSKVSCLQAKERLLHRCFSVSFTKDPPTSFSPVILQT